MLKAGELPNFARLEREGSWTHNARTDFDKTITLPNHTSMVTGRPVEDLVIGERAVAGHLWKINSDEQPENLHGNRKSYIASTFDVVHDHGLRTALMATKTKFKIYENSYDGSSGAADTIGTDNGRDKIDFYLISEADSPALLAALAGMMKADPANYNFVHFHDADQAGHAHNWGSAEYNAAIKAVDGYLGAILDLVATDSTLQGETAVIVSADHGGFQTNHFDNANRLNYTIPFFVWGAGVARGERPVRAESPGSAERSAPGPARLYGAGNAAADPQRRRWQPAWMSLLGLPAIPDSLIDAQRGSGGGTAREPASQAAK